MKWFLVAVLAAGVASAQTTPSSLAGEWVDVARPADSRPATLTVDADGGWLLERNALGGRRCQVQGWLEAIDGGVAWHDDGAMQAAWDQRHRLRKSRSDAGALAEAELAFARFCDPVHESDLLSMAVGNSVGSRELKLLEQVELSPLGRVHVPRLFFVEPDQFAAVQGPLEKYFVWRRATAPSPSSTKRRWVLRGAEWWATMTVTREGNVVIEGPGACVEKSRVMPWSRELKPCGPITFFDRTSSCGRVKTKRVMRVRDGSCAFYPSVANLVFVRLEDDDTKETVSVFPVP